MKKIFLLYLLIYLPFTVISQGKMIYQVHVTDQDQNPLGGIAINCIESNTFQKLHFITNQYGKAELNIVGGDNWIVNIGGMKNYTDISMPKYGEGSGSTTVTYDVEHWKRITALPVDRSKLLLEIVHQNIPPRPSNDPKTAIVEIQVLNPLGQAWRDVPIALTSYELNQSFTSRTNNQGIARLEVPKGQNYQLDLDGEENFSYCDIPKNGGSRRLTIPYEKIRYNEKVNRWGDIDQEFIDKPKPISNRVLVNLQVTGGERNGANEHVFLKMTYSNKTYHGMTNDRGEVTFLLPKQRTYLVSFQFQKNVDVLDLSTMRGIGRMSASYKYEPDPKLQYPENFLPTKDQVKSFNLNDYNKKRFPKQPQNEDIINVYAKWGANTINSGTKEALLELGFSVNEPKLKNRISKPLNLAFVLDKSGSMSGESIDLLKAAMLNLIDKLRKDDQISLIFFDSEAKVVYPQGKVNKSEIEELISALHASGGTNIYDGLKMGYEEINKTYQPHYTNRVILLTDGYGSKPVDYVLEQSAAYFKKGIAVSTIGVGESYNVNLLNLLSKYSGGLEHSVIDSEGIDDALIKEFESLFHPIVTDLNVSIEYNDQILYKTLYGIPEKTKKNNSVTFGLEEVFSSLNLMAIVKFKLDQPNRLIEKEKIKINISYFDEIKKEAVKITKTLGLTWVDETDTEQIYDANFKDNYSFAVIIQATKAIADLCDAGNYSAAKQNITDTFEYLDEINNLKFSADLVPHLQVLKGYLEAIEKAISNESKY